MRKTNGKAKRSGTRQVKDLPVKNTKDVKGGSLEVTAISNIMKTRHDTVKNSISNVR